MLPYAHMNPNMTVPVLEIDGKIICDSLEILRYLRGQAPGPGDLAAPRKEADAFIEMCDQFDEGLFTYRRLGAAGGVANQLRQLRLRQALSEALGIKHGCFSGMTQSSPDKSAEVLRNGQTVLETYVKKIAQIQLIDDAG